jgi:hypothetical protein
LSSPGLCGALPMAMEIFDEQSRLLAIVRSWPGHGGLGRLLER